MGIFTFPCSKPLRDKKKIRKIIALRKVESIAPEGRKMRFRVRRGFKEQLPSVTYLDVTAENSGTQPQLSHVLLTTLAEYC